MARFNPCSIFGTVFVLLACILIVFGEIGQINTTLVPRHIRLITVDTSGLGSAVAAASGGQATADGIYGTPSTSGSTDMPADGTGVRTFYEWGAYRYCTSNDGVGGVRSYCSDRSLGFKFQPNAVIYRDVPSEYKDAYMNAIPDSVFQSDDYLGRFSMAASWLVFIGALISGLALLCAFIPNRFFFFLASLVTLLAALVLGVGTAIYTAMASRTMGSINDVFVTVAANSASVGVNVSYGNGLWILWAATACLLIAVVPLLMGCCFGRKREKQYA